MTASSEEITQQILGAWDEVTGNEPEPEETPEEEQPEAAVVEEEPSEEPGEEEVGEEEDEEGEDAEEEGGGEGAELAEPEDEEEVTAAYTSADPQVQAYLNRFGGDVEKALQNEVHLQLLNGRLGQDKAVLTRQVAELQAEIAQLQTFGPGAVLSPEQRAWVEEALQSGNPAAYVQQALGANEFGLARAITDEWGQDSPYDAWGLRQVIDRAEWQSQEPVEQPEFDRNALNEILVEHYPDMETYAGKMIELLSSLGDQHPLVQDARSNDPESAARGIIGIYEVARASTASMKTTREQLQRDGRKKADDARTRAVVSSAQATPKPSETPRPREIMPGLTMDELEAEWSRGK